MWSVGPQPAGGNGEPPAHVCNDFVRFRPSGWEFEKTFKWGIRFVLSWGYIGVVKLRQNSCNQVGIPGAKQVHVEIETGGLGH